MVFFQSLKEEIVVNNDKKLIKRLLNELEVSLNTTLALFFKKSCMLHRPFENFCVLFIVCRCYKYVNFIFYITSVKA